MNLVESLFAPLNEANVNYCLLRNEEFLEGEKLNNDVDVLISSEHRTRAETALQDNGFIKARDEPTLYTYYLRMNPNRKQLDILHVCWDNVMYNTLPITNGSRILRNKVQHESQPVWIPSKEDMFVQLTFHSILNRGFFKEKYKNNLIHLSDIIDKSEVEEHAVELFGDLGRHTIQLISSGNFANAIGQKWKLVMMTVLRHPSRIPRFLYVLLVYYQISRPFKKFNKRYNPFVSPPTIALIGPDGTGKSTLTKYLTKELNEMGISAERTELGVYNDRTLFMEILHHINDYVTNYDHETNKKERSRGALKIEDRNGLFKSTIYFLDQLIRYVQANMRGADVLIADRYIHDIALYHHRSFMRLLPLFENRRTFVFILNAEPEIISGRSEYDRDSIEEMQSRLSVLNHERVDVSKSISEVMSDLRARITNSRFVSLLK